MTDTDRLLQVLQELVLQVEAADQASSGIFLFASTHGVVYDGPQYGEQLKAAKRVLQQGTERFKEEPVISKEHTKDVPSLAPEREPNIQDKVYYGRAGRPESRTGKRFIRVNAAGTATEEVDPAFEQYEEDIRDIENRFTYHPPKGDQTDRYEALRWTAQVLAKEIIIRCPRSRERSRAINKLEEAIMLANAAIARNE